MFHRIHGLGVAVSALLASSAFAQTTFTEVEPNTNKNEATLANGMIAGDSVTGTTTGVVTTALSTLGTSVDYFRVKTAALPLGIYKHKLTLSTTGVVGHTVSIRGLTQTAGAINAGTDVSFQGATTLAPFAPANTRASAWFGFGRQEEIYYRVEGTASTTAPYVATLATTAVTPQVVTQPFNAGTIRVTTVGQTTTDTEIYVYDSNLNPIAGYHNDDEGPAGLTSQSRVLRTFTPGDYYAIVSRYNLANNQADANPDEDFLTDNVLDLPDGICLSLTDVVGADYDLLIDDGANPTQVTVLGGGFFDMSFVKFTVSATPVPPNNDLCSNARVATTGVNNGTLAGTTNDGIASCDVGGAGSRDVWYTFTTTSLPYGGTLSLNTCGSVGVDTTLAVYNACGGSELACNDDCGGAPCAATSSCLSVSVASNQTYWIRVGDKGLGGGAFILNVSVVPNAPTNDGCATPLVLAGPGLYPVDNSLATTGTEGQTESLCTFFGGTAVPKDLWYTYTPTTNGTVAVTTCGFIPVPPGPSTDSKIAIYAGTGCPVAGTAIACNDDAGTGTGSGTACTAAGFNSYIEFAATCGVTYTIQIGMYWASTSSILGQFSVSETGGAACATPVTYFCFGDGTGLACPCANNGAAGNGCANSLNANGGNLVASGNASVSADTWTIAGSGIPNGPGLYYQAINQLGGGNGVLFGDGIRCIGGSVIRLGIVTAAGNASSYPSPNPPAVNAIPISVKGFNLAGDVRNYQLWYRDSTIGFCTANVFNLTNAVNVTWLP